MQPDRAVINDKNKELINCYKVVRDSVDDLIEELRKHEKKNKPDYFYEIRKLDRSTEKYKRQSAVKKAARIIYLNKTCYNGLFRVNSQGQFNVPFGKYKKPKILDEAVLKAVSEYLNKNDVTILNRDFKKAVEDAKEGDFVYFDPPYHPVSETASFTGYNVKGFNGKKQEELRDVFNDLAKRDCFVILSNSDTKFIRELYQEKEYTIKTVKAARSINSQGLKRGKINEILVLSSSIAKMKHDQK